MEGKNLPEGGSAFPMNYAEGTNFGMSMRDYFAARALGLINENMKQRGANMSFEAIASTAYNIADAMLSERNKKPDQ